jgi:hypothetical protein
MLNNGGTKLEQIEIILRDRVTDNLLPVYIDINDNSLSRKWLTALNNILHDELHLEKNYCWFGFANGERNAEYICTQINQSIAAINSADLGYTITDFFSPANTIQPDLDINHDKMNHLHRYFEDLQGVSGAMSLFYNKATPNTRWHIRQLNLLCHEYESLVLSMRKAVQAPEWQRPSQLMCWLNAPRFELEPEDFELFGIETIARPLGSVYVGVNKAVGKHHWEVFHDEGRDSRIGELTTGTLRSQTLASGDFDIEWGQNPDGHPWMHKELTDFRQWLVNNGFDPNDKSLTIGHPNIGQVDLLRSFNSKDHYAIWQQLNTHLDVYSVSTSTAKCVYNYHWSDTDYVNVQIKHLNKGSV